MESDTAIEERGDLGLSTAAPIAVLDAASVIPPALIGAESMVPEATEVLMAAASIDTAGDATTAAAFKSSISNAWVEVVNGVAVESEGPRAGIALKLLRNNTELPL